jgi:hypothetical protein
MASEQHIRKALDHLSGLDPVAADSPPAIKARRSLRAPLDEHPWLQDPGITAIGLAERVTEGETLAEPVLKVYVEKKLPLSQCRFRIPAQLNIEGLPPIPIDVVQTGRIVLHSNTAKVRPAPPGYSASLAGDAPGTGTFGLVMRKRGQPSPFYLLSNSHAIANSGMATQGQIVTQPGAADGGVAQDGIAQLAEWVPYIFSDQGFPNLVDAAIAALDPGAATSAIAQIGIPTGINTNLTRGMQVQKVGRTTTFSIAFVRDIDLRLASTYPRPGGQVGRVGFSDQVLTSFYTSPGDSGSGVLDMQGQVVGLHFAGSETVGVFNKISNVLDALDLEVVTTAVP